MAQLTQRPEPPPQGWLELRPLIVQRVEAGIPRERVAAVMGMSDSWLARLERGGVPVVSSEHRKAYAAALATLGAT